MLKFAKFIHSRNLIFRFSTYIRPACLWQSNNINVTTVTATGWGLLEVAGTTSDDLQKVDLTVLENNFCDPFFDTVRKYDKSIDQLRSSQMCAAAYENERLTGNKDTCQGQIVL